MRMTAPSERGTPSMAVEIVGPDRWLALGNEWLANFTSTATRATYGSAWKNFLSWLGCHPEDVTRAHVIAYRDELALKCRPSTIGVRLAALASFYDLAVSEQLIDRNPCEGVERPEVAAYAGARWLTSAEARTLLQTPDRNTLEGKRDFAILMLMLTMGLRRAEVAGIHTDDLSERGDGSGELRYRPKGGQDQSRPVPAIAWRATMDYWQARGELAGAAPLFVAHDHAAGARKAGCSLTGESIRGLVGRYTKAALGREVNPHALRHTAASELWDICHDLRKVQAVLGHASATTTERYLHRVNDDRGALGDALSARYGFEYARPAQSPKSAVAPGPGTKIPKA